MWGLNRPHLYIKEKKMKDKFNEKIHILARLCVIVDLLQHFYKEKTTLEKELEQIEEDERKSNHN